MEIKSEYVKSKIKGKSFQDTEFEMYLFELRELEKIVLGKWRSRNKQDRWDLVTKEELREDYEAIFKELKPKKYAQYKKNEAKIRKTEDKLRKKFQEHLKKRRAKAKKEWLALGGIVDEKVEK